MTSLKNEHQSKWPALQQDVNVQDTSQFWDRKVKSHITKPVKVVFGTLAYGEQRKKVSKIFCIALFEKKIFVPGKKYFAGNYGFTLKKIESVVVVVVLVVVVVVVSKSSERFKALPIELEI